MNKLNLNDFINLPASEREALTNAVLASLKHYLDQGYSLALAKKKTLLDSKMVQATHDLIYSTNPAYKTIRSTYYNPGNTRWN